MTNCPEHPRNSPERDKIGMPTDNTRRNKTTITEGPPEGRKHEQCKPKQGNQNHTQVSKWSKNLTEKHKGP